MIEMYFFKEKSLKLTKSKHLFQKMVYLTTILKIRVLLS